MLGTLPRDLIAEIEYCLSEPHRDVHIICNIDYFDSGNRHFIEAISVYIENIIKDLKEQNEASVDIYYCFIESLGVEAYAIGTVDGRYCIAFSVATILKVSAAFHYLIGTAGFSEIMQTSPHGFRVPPFQGFNERQFLEGCILHEPPSIGHDALTKAQRLISCFTTNVILHELGHIFNGHLHYGTEYGPFKAILESQTEINIYKESLFSQTIEMDADAFAINWLFNNVISKNKLTGDAAIRAVKEIYLSLYSAHRLIQSDRFDATKTFEMSHPHPILRCLLITATIGKHFENGRFGYPESLWASVWPQIAGSFEQSFVELTGTYPDGANMETAYNYFQSEYISLLLRNFALIRPELEKHRLGKGKLAPPQVG